LRRISQGGLSGRQVQQHVWTRSFGSPTVRPCRGRPASTRQQLLIEQPGHLLALTRWTVAHRDVVRSRSGSGPGRWRHCAPRPRGEPCGSGLAEDKPQRTKPMVGDRD
jgi:hypothetical protein